jgi:hypothetical protein
MRLEKIAQTVAQHAFCQNQCITSATEKGSQKMWATSIILKKLPKENNRSMGYNSPVLVTLASPLHPVLILSHGP